jgi:hypothetical protein
MFRALSLSLALAVVTPACDDEVVGDADVSIDSGDDADVPTDAGADADHVVHDAEGGEDSDVVDGDDDGSDCEDNDGDGHCSDGDCDDSLETGRTCFAGCLVFHADGDGDGYGDSEVTATACVTPDGYTTDSTDCDDSAAAHWSDCDLCVDADGDGYGEGCNLGEDCDDTVFTGASCHELCTLFFVDRDGDGHGGGPESVNACEQPVGYALLSDDCDDSAPEVYPGATELCGDDVDNNCSGEDVLCPEPGDILITEVMQDPSALGDTEGEWFELFNTTDAVIDLQGLVIRDDDLDLHHIEAPLEIEPGDYLVLARSGTAAPIVDYVYSDFLLANDDDEVLLATFGTDGTDGLELSGIRYDAGLTFPDPSGASMNLDIRLYERPGAERGDSWCVATTPFGFGDLGTPGLSNDECLWPPRLDSLEPLECVSAGGAQVTIVGAHFFDIISVDMGGVGSAFSVVSPWVLETFAPAHGVGWVDVTVSNALGSDTLVDGFLFTGTTDAVTSCSIVTPTSTMTSAGVPTETITGRVLVSGVTDGPGQGSGIDGQIGMGLIDSNPTTDSDWIWSNALYESDDGATDVYASTLVVLEPGTYAYAYRFTVDAGLTYLYCDADGSTAADPYDPASQGVLAVNP